MVLFYLETPVLLSILVVPFVPFDPVVLSVLFCLEFLETLVVQSVPFDLADPSVL